MERPPLELVRPMTPFSAIKHLSSARHPAPRAGPEHGAQWSSEAFSEQGNEASETNQPYFVNHVFAFSGLSVLSGSRLPASM